MTKRFTRQDIINILTEANEQKPPAKELAQKLGVSLPYMHMILNGRKWKTIDRDQFPNIRATYCHKKALTDTQVNQIRRLWNSGEMKHQGKLAEKFKVSTQTIRKVVRYQYSAFSGKHKKYLTGDQLYV